MCLRVGDGLGALLKSSMFSFIEGQAPQAMSRTPHPTALSQQRGKGAERAALWHCSTLVPEEARVTAGTLAARVPVGDGSSTSS